MQSQRRGCYAESRQKLSEFWSPYSLADVNGDRCKEYAEAATGKRHPSLVPAALYEIDTAELLRRGLSASDDAKFGACTQSSLR
jgi:hypothetical protein